MSLELMQTNRSRSQLDPEGSNFPADDASHVEKRRSTPSSPLLKLFEEDGEHQAIDWRYKFKFSLHQPRMAWPCYQGPERVREAKGKGLLGTKHLPRIRAD